MERNDWKLLKEIAELEKTPQGLSLIHISEPTRP